MLSYPNIVGNQEDWANVVTNVEMEETPFLDWLPTGEKPENVEKSYQAERYADPDLNNVQIDGRPVTGFLAAGDNRARLKAVVQYFTKTSSVTRLHQDVSNIAGIPDELAHDILKRTKELGRDIECAFLSQNESQDDTGVQGYKTRGAFRWVQAGAQADRPVDPNFRPPAASISTASTATLSENLVLDVLQSMATVQKGARTMTGFVGPGFKRLFNNLPLFTPQSALLGGGTGATGIVMQKQGRTIDRTFERYNTDFGVLDLPGISFLNNYGTGTPTYNTHSALFLHQNMWQLSWGPGVDGKVTSGKPNWMRKEYQGGAYEAFCEAICMLLCYNPRAEGAYLPAT